MRILHLLGERRLPRDPDREGASGLVRAALEIARAQHGLGHDAHVVVTGDESWRRQWHGVTLVGLRKTRPARLSLGRRTFDLTHHLPYVAYTLRQPFDVAHGHIYGYLRFLRARARIVHFHSDPFFAGTGGEGFHLTPADVATIDRTSHALVAVSAFVAGEVQRRLDSPGPVHIVHNGVDSNRFYSDGVREARSAVRRDWGVRDDDVAFLFSGAIVPDKGVVHLARAFARVAQQNPSVHLVLAGARDLWAAPIAVSSPDAAYEKEVLDALGELVRSRRVHVLGKVGYETMPTVYAASDAVVLPSLVKEGCPLAVLEAMAAARPTIASNLGGTVELVTAETGILVGAGDEPALEAAMRAIADDRARRVRLGAAARDAVRDRSWDRVAESLDAIYNLAITRQARNGTHAIARSS